MSQTLKSQMASLGIEICKSEDTGKNVEYERSQWVLNAPAPPTLWHQFKDSVRKTISQVSYLLIRPASKLFLSILRGIFPILDWGRNYTVIHFRNDLLAGLTIASLCIPQVIDSKLILESFLPI